MPKQLSLFILLSFIVFQTVAQRLNTDSLWRITETSNNDSLRLQAISTLHYYYISIEIDSNFYYNSRVSKICEKLNTLRYTALGSIFSAYFYYRIGDNKTVQEHITKAAAIAEKIDDKDILSRVENFRSLIENDSYKRIEHYRKAIQYRNTLNKATQLSTTLLGNLSAAFLATNQIDSAFFYAQKMYESSIKANDTLSSYVTAIMGNVYLKLNQHEVAYAFYKKGIQAAKTTMRINDLMRAYFPMANYFDKMNQPDSAFYYYKKPFEYGPKEIYTTKLFASKKIYEYYLKKGNNDSAAKYMNFYIIANDSINSSNKVAQVQAAKLEDELQQHEFEKAKAEDRENRNHNIQLAILAIAILSAIILFLLLSRSIIVSHKVVEFLNVVVLLIVFEFINLLIHPFLEKVTDHSPALMLIALVSIAALIVPLHHRLEKWTTHKLVEKNKAVRLANAKKTIEELEENSKA